MRKDCCNKKALNCQDRLQNKIVRGSCKNLSNRRKKGVGDKKKFDLFINWLKIQVNLHLAPISINAISCFKMLDINGNKIKNY